MKITKEAESVWAPLSRAVLERLFQETRDYEKCTHALLFALGRLVTYKEPDLKKLEEDLVAHMSVEFLFPVMQGAAHQVGVGHGEYGGLILEKGS